MKTKIFFYSLFLIGFISIFLPFDTDFTIHCDFINTSVSQQENTIPLIGFFKNISFYNLNFSKILQIIAAVLITGPFIFSALLFFYKKYRILVILNRIPFTIFIVLGLTRKFENLQIGYYLLVFQQVSLFILLILMKVKNRQNQTKLSQV